MSRQDIPVKWKRLSIGVIKGGIGGLSVAIAFRRAGHKVTIYEKSKRLRGS